MTTAKPHEIADLSDRVSLAAQLSTLAEAFHLEATRWSSASHCRASLKRDALQCEIAARNALTIASTDESDAIAYAARGELARIQSLRLVVETITHSGPNHRREVAE